jgi:hypothetical protein
MQVHTGGVTVYRNVITIFQLSHTRHVMTRITSIKDMYCSSWEHIRLLK